MKKILQILIMLVVVFWGNKVAAPVSISNIPDLPITPPEDDPWFDPAGLDAPTCPIPYDPKPIPPGSFEPNSGIRFFIYGGCWPTFYEEGEIGIDWSVYCGVTFDF